MDSSEERTSVPVGDYVCWGQLWYRLNMIDGSARSPLYQAGHWTQALFYAVHCKQSVATMVVVVVASMQGACVCVSHDHCAYLILIC